MVYYIMLGFALVGFFAKTLLRFDAVSSLVVSFILTILFIVLVWNTPKQSLKLVVIGIAISIELVVFLGLFKAIENLIIIFENV